MASGASDPGGDKASDEGCPRLSESASAPLRASWFGEQRPARETSVVRAPARYRAAHTPPLVSSSGLVCGVVVTKVASSGVLASAWCARALHWLQKLTRGVGLGEATLVAAGVGDEGLVFGHGRARNGVESWRVGDGRWRRVRGGPLVDGRCLGSLRVQRVTARHRIRPFGRVRLDFRRAGDR